MVCKARLSPLSDDRQEMGLGKSNIFIRGLPLVCVCTSIGVSLSQPEGCLKGALSALSRPSLDDAEGTSCFGANGVFVRHALLYELGRPG